MQKQTRNPLDLQLHNLRCPRCRKLLARLSHGAGSVVEIRCPRCKSIVQSNPDGSVFADQELTAAIQ
jgi:phage FluMu protein Com